VVGLNITTNLRPKARPPPRSPSPRRCGPPRPLARRQPTSPLDGPLRFCVVFALAVASPWLPRLLSVNVHSRSLSLSLSLRQVQYLIEGLGVPKSEVGRLVLPRPRRPSPLCLRGRAAPCRRSGALRGAGSGGAVPIGAGDEHREQDQAGDRLPGGRGGHPARQARPGRRPLPAGLRPAQPSQPNSPSVARSSRQRKTAAADPARVLSR
jgi:hypothetical protein